MPELPWKKFYPQDWKADPQLSRCSPATRGIWMDAIASMMLSNTDHISGTDAELARDCRCSEAEIQAANDELRRANVCKISMQNGCKTWTCRRLERELNVSKSRSNAASKRWGSDAKPMQKDNANTLHDVNANSHARSASASVYASVSASELEWGCKGETADCALELTTRICRLFQREGRGLTLHEQAEMASISRRPLVLEELAKIVCYRDTLPANRRHFFPQSVSALIGKWDDVLDRAGQPLPTTTANKPLPRHTINGEIKL